MSFSFVDLFCGIGGFHAALAAAGGQPVLASDIDPKASRIYANNWLGGAYESVHTDVRDLTRDRCRAVPEHDVLAAGFPCQPFSKSGRQLGVAEERGQLFYNILKVLQYRRPRIVLLENVRNLVGPRHRGDYERILTLMRDLGYAVSGEPMILSPHRIPPDAGGAPQHRERVFIVGVHSGTKGSSRRKFPRLSDIAPQYDSWDATSWDLRSFLRPHAPTGAERARLKVKGESSEALEVWEAFVEAFIGARGPLATLPGFPMWTDFWKPRSQVRISRDVPDWKRQLILKNVAFYEANARWIDSWRRSTAVGALSPSLRKFEWQAGQPNSLRHCLIQLRPSGVRVKRPNYTPALVAIGQTPILGWDQRELSINEAAALQCLPTGMDFSGQSRTDSLKQLGNAVNVGAAKYALEMAYAAATQLKLKWTREITVQDRYLDSAR